MARWSGKIVGGMVGAVVGGPVGAVVGGSLGHLVDQDQLDVPRQASFRHLSVLPLGEPRYTGLDLRLRLEIDGCHNEPCLLQIHCLDGERQPIPARIEEVAGPRGEAVWHQSFMPGYRSVLYDEVHLYLPYAALDLERSGMGWLEISLLHQPTSEKLAHSSLQVRLVQQPPLPPQQNPNQKESTPSPPPPPLEPEYLNLLQVLVSCALVDGPIQTTEIRQIKDFFKRKLRFGPQELESVRRALKKILTQRPQISALYRLRHTLDPEMSRGLFRLLLRICQSDGPLNPQEIAYLKQAAPLLQIPPELVAGMIESPKSQALQILELPLDASLSQIKQAYRRLIKEVHPDRFPDLSETQKEEAHQRIAELNKAYQLLLRASSSSPSS